MANKEDLEKLQKFREKVDEFRNFLEVRQAELDYEDLYGFSPFQKLLQELQCDDETTAAGCLTFLIDNHDAELNS